MLTFRYNEEHRPEAIAGKHDDRVMAAAICYAARHQQRSVPEEPAPEKAGGKLIERIERGKRVPGFR